MILKKMLPLASLLSVLGVLASASPAHAATVECNITGVLFAPDTGGGEVQIKCGNTWYYGDTTSSMCTGKGAETVKAWLSLAQAATLGTRAATLNYTGVCLQYVMLR